MARPTITCLAPHTQHLPDSRRIPLRSVILDLVAVLRVYPRLMPPQGIAICPLNLPVPLGARSREIVIEPHRE